MRLSMTIKEEIIEAVSGLRVHTCAKPQNCINTVNICTCIWPKGQYIKKKKKKIQGKKILTKIKTSTVLTHTWCNCK